MIKIDDNTTIRNYAYGIEFLYEENNTKEVFHFPDTKTALRFYMRKSLSNGIPIEEINQRIEEVKKQTENGEIKNER